MRTSSFFAFALSASVASAHAADAEVRVDLSMKTGKVATARHYGLNLFQAWNPETGAAPGYRSALSAMRPGLVRFHSWEMLRLSSQRNGWIKTGATWDEEKIKAALAAFETNAEIMMNVPALPGVDGRKMTAAEIEAFARFAADLVRIVNVDAKRRVRYWEIPNEQEDHYTGAELAALVLKAATAMRAVDPTIKVGGPAWKQPWAAGVQDFLRAAANDLDFISFHLYGGAPGAGDVPAVLKKGAELGGASDDLRRRMQEITSRPLELFHDEWNIAWSGPDERMTGALGAVFDALALGSLAQSAADGATVWNESDGWYGKLEGPGQSFRRRPASYVFELYGRFLVGPVVRSTSTATDVWSFAVAGPSGNALALVNRANATKTVRVSFTGGSGGDRFELHLVGANGVETQTAVLDGDITLPALSVAVLANATRASIGTDAAPGSDAAADGGATASDAAREGGTLVAPDAGRDAIGRDSRAPAPPEDDDVPSDDDVRADDGDEEVSAGCACHVGAPHDRGGWLAAALGMVALARRRRRAALSREQRNPPISAR